MTRRKKLLIVTLVLLLGFGLAWPFRKTSSETSENLLVDSQAVRSVPSRRVTAIERSPDGSSPAQVPAKMTSIGKSVDQGRNEQLAASFDLANHPALATPIAPLQAYPVTPIGESEDLAKRPSYAPAQTQRYSPASANQSSVARPAYQTFASERGFDHPAQHANEVKHIVQNYDTLERLAKRYLGDEGRALEIFDLNRDVLDNPHLLPINAQLRIPPRH